MFTRIDTRIVIHQVTGDPSASSAGIYRIVVMRSPQETVTEPTEDVECTHLIWFVILPSPPFSLVRFLDCRHRSLRCYAATLEMVCYSSSLCRRSDAGGCGSLFLDQFRLWFLCCPIHDRSTRILIGCCSSGVLSGSFLAAIWGWIWVRLRWSDFVYAVVILVSRWSFGPSDGLGMDL